MKRVLLTAISFLCLIIQANAQTPQYYVGALSGGGTGTESTPFATTTDNQIQLLYPTGGYNTTPASGYITKLYFKAGSTASASYTNVTLKLGNSTLTTLPLSWTTGLTTVYNKATTISGSTNQWFAIALDIPFYYDNTKSLVVEISQSGSGSGPTLVSNTGSSAYTHVYGSAGSATPSNQDISVYDFGMDVCTAAIPVVTVDPHDSAVCQGGNVAFSVSATGTSLSYQWQALSGSSYTDITNGGVYSGANASLLVLTNPTALMSGNKYRCIVTNACGLSDTSAEGIMTIKPIPTVNAVTNQSVCNNGYSDDIIFSGAVNNTTYNFVHSNATIIPYATGTSGSGNMFSFLVRNATTAPIIDTITITPVANGCIGSNRTFTITANPEPTVDLSSIPNLAICNGAIGGATTFTGPVAGTTFNWTNSNSALGIGTSGTGYISAFTASNSGNTPVVGTITVTPSINGCAGSSRSFTITINPTPTVNAVTNQSVCNNGYSNDVIYSGAVNNTTYNFVHSNASIIPYATGNAGSGNMYSFLVRNTTTAPIIDTITVTPIANSCVGANKSFTITALPEATVDPASIPNLSICNNAIGGATTFAGPVSGSTFTWANNTTSIGLSASGSGNISNFTATNSGSTPVAATITVTPTANGCVGTSSTFTITAKPTPTVTAASIPNISICNNTIGGATTFASPVSGATYAWTNDNTAIGLAANGTGNIAGFTAVNSGLTPVIANITVTPTVSGCVGTASSFKITANPTPTVSASSIPNLSFCNNTAGGATTFAGPVSGTTFAWTNNTSSIGLSASGSGNISNFTASNSGSTPVTATITVTPTANSCAGPSSNFTITVKPTPTITPASIPNIAVCNQNLVGGVTFSSPVSGATFSWTNDNTTIGLGANGSGNISSFIATNSNPNAVSATVAVTSTADGCIGNANFTITVNTPPAISGQPNNRATCEGSNTVFNVTATGSGLTYKWQEDNGGGFVDLPNVPPYSGVTTSSLTLIGTPLPMNNNKYRCIISGTCSPSITSSEVTLTVNRLPAITSHPSDVYVCQGVDTAFYVSAIGANITYQWQVDAGSGFTNLSNSAQYGGVTTPRLAIIAPNYSINNNKYRCVVSGACTPQAASLAANMQVRPVLILSQTIKDSVCEGEPVVMNVNTYGSGLKYQWQVKTPSGSYVDLTNNTKYSSVTTDHLNIMQADASLDNNMYRCKVYDDLVCNISVYSAEIPLNINILPVVSGISSPIEKGQPAVLTLSSTLDASVTYQWQEDKHNGTGFVSLHDNTDYSGTNTPTLTINSVNMSQDNYSYRCILGNYCTNIVPTASAILDVYDPTAIGKTSFGNAGIIVYPNPVSGAELFIKMKQRTTNVHIRVMDVVGRVLISRDAEISNSKASVDVSSLHAGTYSIEVSDNANHSSATVPFTKL